MVDAFWSASLESRCPSISPYPDFVTPMRAGRFLGPNDVQFDGRPHPQVQVRIGEQYDFRDAFHRAQAERDPQFAPHIGFLKLAPGNDAVALGFIRECGPLFRKTWDAGKTVQIDLNDFWLRHSRFVAIAKIYEAFSDPESLYSAMAEVSKNQDQLDEAGPASIGCIPDNDGQNKYTRLGYLDPPEFYLRKNPDGSSFLELELVKSQARKILFSELTLQTHEGIRSGWTLAQEVDNDQIAFRPTRVLTSLWAAIWEMLGFPGNFSGVGLEIMPHLREVFLSTSTQQRLLQAGTSGTLEQATVRQEAARIKNSPRLGDAAKLANMIEEMKKWLSIEEGAFGGMSLSFLASASGRAAVPEVRLSLNGVNGSVGGPSNSAQRA